MAQMEAQMKQEAKHTLARQWAMLRAIPRSPQRATTTQIASRLADEGHAVTRRTIERDLQGLSTLFPLSLDDRSKPYGWSWARDANFEFMPRLTASQAVALLLAQSHLQVLLPRSMRQDLLPVFEAAQAALAASGWKDWHRVTAVVPTTLPLLAPRIPGEVIDVVQHALAQGRCLQGTYRAKGAEQARRWTIHPLGLLARGSMLYLVGTLDEYGDVRQLALHRLTDVSWCIEPRTKPKGFDFREYASGHGARLLASGMIQLVCRFETAAAEHLRESPLSVDQSWEPEAEGKHVRVAATVTDDELLKWWLLAFGSQVEVIAPTHIRDAMREEHRLASRMYE